MAGLVMVKSFASYELCMAFLVEPCVCVVPKVDKFSCADNHADFKASNINVYLIPPSLCFTARIARRIMHIKRPGHPPAARHLMVCHQFTCKIGRVIYALKCVKHETNADAASNCFSKLCRVLSTTALLPSPPPCST